MSNKLFKIFIVVYLISTFYPFPYIYFFNTLSAVSVIVLVVFLFFVQGFRMKLFLVWIAIVLSFLMDLILPSYNITDKHKVFSVTYYKVLEYGEVRYYKKYDNFPIYFKKNIGGKGTFAFITQSSPEDVMARFCDLKEYCTEDK